LSKDPGKAGKARFLLEMLDGNANMKASISKEMQAKITAFKQVIDAILEDQIDFDTCVEVILGQGMESILAGLLGSVAPEILLQSFQHLAARHPAAVYGYVAEVLQRGTAIQQEKMQRLKEEMQRRIGFQSPQAAEQST
jgi:hypothetical protein